MATQATLVGHTCPHLVYLESGDVRGLVVQHPVAGLVPLVVRDEEYAGAEPLITAMLLPLEARRLAALLLATADEATS